MPRLCPRLRFSLGTLLVLVAILSIWVAYHLKWISERREAREWIKSHGGAFERLTVRSYPQEPSKRAPLMLRMLGEDEVGAIFMGSTAPESEFNSEEKVREIQELFPESELLYNREMLRKAVTPLNDSH